MNVSNYTNTGTSEFQIPSGSHYINTCFAVLLVFLSLLAITVLSNCTKLVFQIKYTSIQLTVSNILFGLTVISDPIYYVVHGNNCYAVIKLFAFCFTIYYIFLTITGIDRVLSLKFAMKYTFWTRRRNAYITTIIIYAVAILLNIPNFTGVNGEFKCDGHPREILTYQGLMVFSFTLLILLLVQIASYGYIGIDVLNRYRKSRDRSSGSRNAFKNFLKVTVKSFYLCVLSAALIGPFVVYKLIEALTGYIDENLYKQTFLLVVLIYLHQILSPIFILLAYEECRYRLLIIFYHFNKEKRSQLDAEFKQHYASFGISVIAE